MKHLFVCSLFLLGILNGSVALANAECANADPNWIWCDDFEVDRTASYFETVNPNIQNDVGIEGSKAAVFTFNAGVQTAGNFKLAFGRTPSSYFRPVDDGSADYREIYWRIFVRHPNNWVGNGADKLTRAIIFTGSDWSQAAVAHVWSGADPGPNSHLLGIDPASGTNANGIVQTSGYNDWANFRWLGLDYSDSSVFGDEQKGTWQCVEAHMKLNTAGASDGFLKLYVNDSLEVERTGLNWVGAYDDYGINAIFLENYWNAGSPATQSRTFDNFVVSTARIGCNGSSVLASTPKPPIVLD